MHTGSYDDEPETIQKIDAFLEEQGYETDFSGCRMHHEIYLSDPRRTAPEKLRQNADILNAVRYFMDNDLPVASICHGQQILISSGRISGRRATCYPGIRDDLVNAGALYENAPVVVDRKLVTSRRPEDLPYFMREFIKLL